MLQGVKRILNLNHIQSKLDDLKKMTRFIQGKISLNDITFEFNDPLALYHEYNDIFLKKIYALTTEKKTNLKIIDGGSYIGVSTIFFATAYPNSTIMAFELDIEVFNILQKNLKLNDLQGSTVQAYNFGLGEQENSVPYYSDKSDGGSCLPGAVSGKVKQQVEIMPLSFFITEDPIDLLKLNIEGMECTVIQEIAKKLCSVKQIIIEYHCFGTLPQTLHTILNVLAEQNFKYCINAATSSSIPVPFQLDKNYRMFNLIYAKNMNYPELW